MLNSFIYCTISDAWPVKRPWIVEEIAEASGWDTGKEGMSGSLVVDHHVHLLGSHIHRFAKHSTVLLGKRVDFYLKRYTDLIWYKTYWNNVFDGYFSEKKRPSLNRHADAVWRTLWITCAVWLPYKWAKTVSYLHRLVRSKPNLVTQPFFKPYIWR